jgi:uncharacterized Tic20 family protein
MDNSARNWSMVAHFGGAGSAFLLPSFGWIVPGLVYLTNKTDPKVAKHASEAFQFQLAMACTAWAIGLAGAVLSCFLFGPLLWLAALIPWLASVGFGVLGGVAASSGDRWAYPLLGDELPQ